MTLDELLDTLEGVRPAGTGYVAICPAHDDREASLGVTDTDDRILVTCHAGCATDDVLGALGLSFADLFLQTQRHDEPEAVYHYTDEQGVELFQAVRFPGKRFRQRYKDEEGAWVWNLDGVRRVLYHLPKVLEAVREQRTIAICEGEKDVETILSLGQVATCNPMGAGKWRDEYTEFLRGARKVIIIADRDEPGRKHAETVRKALEEAVEQIVVVQAAKGKDVTDHVNAGLTLEQLVPVKQRVRRGLITAREMAAQGREDLELTEYDIPGYVLCEPVPLVFRQGRMYAIGAYTGDGKTTWALQGARKLCSEGRRALYISLEMPERDLRNKLLSHKGIPLALLEEPWRLRMNAPAYQLYLDGLQEMEGWNLDIVFDTDIGVKGIVDYVVDRESEFVVIDHMHRFNIGDRLRFGDQVRAMTNIALEQNVMLLMLCQLRKFTRGKEIETYPRPSLQDFRETSQIADDASMALAIWRQRDEAGMTYTGHTQVIVLKNRHTTSRVDAAGHFFFVDFDTERQLFVTNQMGVAV